MIKEAMKLALEALELEDMACRYEKEPTPEHIAIAITALREALAEQQEYWEEQPDGSVIPVDPSEMQPVLTPKQRRAAGQWHCPECFTFGHQHRRGCTADHGIKENT